VIFLSFFLSFFLLSFFFCYLIDRLDVTRWVTCVFRDSNIFAEEEERVFQNGGYFDV
jgi:hypothetical protein